MNTIDKTGYSSQANPPSTPSRDVASSGAQPSEPARQSEIARKQYNAAVLQANYDVSISAKNQPHALLYKAAIEAINEELAAELGDDAIERGYESGVDVSPEATAQRIVDFSTGLFELYKQSNPDLEPQEQLDRFLEVIGSGIDQGFGEAREILDGLGVLEGEIEQNVDQTYTLVQEGLAAFRAQIEALLAKTESAPDKPDTA